MVNRSRQIQKELALIRVARGESPADLVIRDARWLNVFTRSFETGDIAVFDGRIAGVGGRYEGKEVLSAPGQFVVPGLIDAHIHLESTLVTPVEFAGPALSHGTTAVICDPHEIANVMGEDGIRYMLEATKGIGLDVFLMLPSCVPATPFDESGASLDAAALSPFYRHARVLGLAEMMNYAGAACDPAVVEKIVDAHAHGKRVDGHAPGLSGRTLAGYVAAGISSDHECTDPKGALEKLRAGMYIMIREGTAAKNLDSLLPLLTDVYRDRILFCSDDKHTSDIERLGHMDHIVRRCVERGVDPALALTVASRNAAEYFGLSDRGAIAGGRIADLVFFEDLSEFGVARVLKNGRTAFEKGKRVCVRNPEISPRLLAAAHGSMHREPVTSADFAAGRKPLIGVMPRELYTHAHGFVDRVDTERDILKIAVLERHGKTGHIGLGYLSGYGLRAGAVATSVSHDSHNIIAVGSSDELLALAVNELIRMGGGIYVTDGKESRSLPLPIAGLMSEASAVDTEQALECAKDFAKSLGVTPGVDPFMTLSFMALPVIPEWKILPGGVFDVTKMAYVEDPAEQSKEKK